MCFGEETKAQPARANREPEIELSEMIQTHLNASVRPDEVGHFIKLHWPRVAALAHRIHGSAS